MRTRVTNNESAFHSGKADEHKIKNKLQCELERLKALTGLGLELRVMWCPTSVSNLSGKVERDTIYIYEGDSGRALDTLRHEFIDYLVSLAIEPYERAASYYRIMVNALIEKIGEEAYSQKERIIEAIKKIFSQENT